MNIEKKQIKSSVVVLEMTGSISMGPDCDRIDQEIQQILGQSVNRVILDLTGVQHLDSAGVGRIVACVSKLKKSGGGLRVAGAGGMVEKVLKMTQVDKVVGLYPTAAAASEGFE